jgi:hypothetical protein
MQLESHVADWMGFLDETGDHNLLTVDPSYPIFATSLLLCRKSDYLSVITPKCVELKCKHFGHEGIVLHSTDIRKSYGAFARLGHAERQEFMEDLADLVRACDFRLIFCAIRKDWHLEKYGPRAANPYNLSLMFALEKACGFCLRGGITALPIVAEARGKNEDADLRSCFDKVLDSGTNYCKAATFAKANMTLCFAKKANNVNGLQLADLAAHPLAKRALIAGYSGKDLPLFWAKVCGPLEGCVGFKIFPDK